MSLGLVAGTLVLLAVQADGTPVSDVDLNDGSVWVTNTQPDAQLLGRLNPQIHQLDLGIQALSGDFDVFQEGATVFLDVRSGGRALREVDVAAGKAADPIVLTPTTKVAFAGGTVALLDRETGDAWVRTVQTIQGFAQDQTEPDLAGNRDGTISVGRDGTAYVFNRDKRTVTAVAIDESGLPAAGDPASLPGPIGPSATATVVGDTPVVYDPDTHTIQWPDLEQPVEVATDDPGSVRLQQPSDSAGEVYVATRADLQLVTFDDGSATTVRSGFAGPPAAPVVHQGFVHAAWADPTTEAYLRLHGSDQPHLERIPEVVGTANLVFRVNRDVVVLNDTVTGDSWLVQEPGLPRVNNWDDVNPAKKKQQLADPDPAQQAKARRTEENRPPVARPDDLGARPGADTILPLTRNDVDLDGDILTIAEVERLDGPKPSEISVVGDGTQLQVRFGPNDGGRQARFRYVATDGREQGTAEAIATVSIIPDNENRPPELIRDGDVPRQTTMTVAAGQRASAYVLQDWTDPDGDPLVLQDAALKEGGTATFRPDGMVEFIDDGQSAGQKTVNVVVSDGRQGGQSDGKLAVTVSRRSGVPPLLLPDRVVGVAGTDILVEPLANDFSRDGSKLNLRDIVPIGGLEITPDSTSGTFVARTSQPDTYYLEYAAYTDRGESSSFVRLDVLPRSKDNLPPVAMRDEALIPPGGHALVDLLANDQDPEGDVLAVTAVAAPIDSGVKASLLQNRLLRLESARDLTGPVSIGYTVSDGVNVAQGSVTVGQATARRDNRPPVAANDRITVRAGSVASVPVLTNDFDPDGDDLQMFQQDIVKPDGLPLFVAGDALRFRAPAKPGELHAAYGVRDSRGQRDDAELIIDVVPDDPKVNAAPQPDPVSARVVGSRPVRLDLGLDGADPDGDAVSLRGLRTAPSLGRITATGLDWIEYEPFGAQRGGTDRFDADVQDKYGAVSTVEIQVGVVPRSSMNQPPVALDDHLLVQPGRTVQYNVVANDADPDGDDLLLEKELQTTASATTARVQDGFISVKVPEVDGAATRQVSMVYQVRDDAGGSDTARLTVEASTDAPFYAPVTRDDAAELSDVAGKVAGDTVLVDVLKNDGDLDGRRQDLRLLAFDTDVSRVDDGKLTIVLSEQDQVVVYEVHDGDENVSYGFVFVSGTDTVPPVLNPDPKLTPIEVDAGKSVDIVLADYILVRAGRTPILTVGRDKVASAPFAGGAEPDGKGALRLTAPGDYYGPASVTFEVTDGTSLNDPTGLTSLLTIPIDVIPPDDLNLPPTLRDIEVLVVGGDEAEEKRVDLAGGATDPNPDDTARLQFSTQSTKLVDARIEDGHVLVLNAVDDVADGEVSDVPITVQDPDGERAEAVARVRLVRSDKPLVTVGTIGPIEAQENEPVSIDINDHATNPYEGQALTVSGAGLEGGEGTASAQGSTVTVTPAARFSGSLSVRFTVHDGSDDPERDVTARMEVTVVAAPEPPGRPEVSSMTHDTVTLSWAPADAKGAPVTEHEVTWPGGSQKCGPATTCLVEHLEPGHEYAFQVTATNRVGASDPSAASASVTPDKVPERMSAPTVVQDYADRDGKLSLTWTAPDNVGSAIKSYEIHLLGTTDTRTATASPFVWDGLSNGSLVQFEIRAVNGITDEARKQLFSAPSTADKAFGVPAQIAPATSVASTDDGVPGGKVQTTWTPPADNGDAIDHYEVTMYRDGRVVTTKKETGTASNFDVDNGHDYTFTITAHNRAGLGDPSVVSEKVNPWDPSGPVRNLTAVPAGEGDRRGRISFDAPADNGGRPIVEYRITSSGGSPKTVSAAGSHDVTFNANNGPYTVTVVPVTQDAEEGKVEGGSDDVGGIRPFGDPAAPTGGGSSPAYRQVNFSGWSAPDGNGRPVKGVQWRQSTDSNWNNGTSYQWPTDEGGQERCINVRTAAEGRTPSDTLYSGERRICGNASPREVKIWFTTEAGSVGPCTANCRRIHFSIEGFRSGTGYHVSTNIIPSSGGAAVSTNVTTDGSGRAGAAPWVFNRSVYISDTYCVTVDNIQACREARDS